MLICQVYLSEAAKNAEIVTSKSSEMNILIPVANDDYVSFFNDLLSKKMFS